MEQLTGENLDDEYKKMAFGAMRLYFDVPCFYLPPLPTLDSLPARILEQAKHLVIRHILSLYQRVSQPVQIGAPARQESCNARERGLEHLFDFLLNDVIRL